MAENKTKAGTASVAAFLNSIDDDGRRKDAKTVAKMMKAVTGLSPKMWGPSIVGFGQYHYTYESGREGDMFRVGFSPRKSNLVVYVIAGFKEYEGLLKKLGKHKIGKSCLYLGRLEQIDLEVLTKLIKQSFAYTVKKYPE